MRKFRLVSAILIFSLANLGVTFAAAQASAVKAISQTDVGLSVYGAFSGRTTGDGIEQSPSNAAGGILEVRHIKNPLVGFEGTYSFNGANQVYSPQITCGLPCGPEVPATISARAHEVTGDWIASLKIANLRPLPWPAAACSSTSLLPGRSSPPAQQSACLCMEAASIGACYPISACGFSTAETSIALPT